MLRVLAERRALLLENDTARLAGHDATSNPADEELWGGVQRVLPAAGPLAPTIAELAATLRVKEAVLRDFLHRKSRSGEVLRVTPDRFYLRAAVATLAATAHELARTTPGGHFTAAQFRDAIGTGRGLAIQILEFFDKIGITQRLGDNRRIGKDFVPILGPARPAQAKRGKSMG